MVVFRHERETTVSLKEFALRRLATVWTLVVGTGLIGSGIVLSFLCVPGTTTVHVFGRAVEIASVGTCCIALGVVLTTRVLAFLRR